MQACIACIRQCRLTYLGKECIYFFPEVIMLFNGAGVLKIHVTVPNLIMHKMKITVLSNIVYPCGILFHNIIANFSCSSSTLQSPFCDCIFTARKLLPFPLSIHRCHWWPLMGLQTFSQNEFSGQFRMCGCKALMNIMPERLWRRYTGAPMKEETNFINLHNNTQRFG